MQVAEHDDHLGERQLSPCLDGDSDQVAPLCPGAVVVLDPILAEELVQHEPRVRRALADATVGDDVIAVQHALVGVDLPQFLGGPEGAVLAHRACTQGTEAALGMCPPRWAPSCS